VIQNPSKKLVSLGRRAVKHYLVSFLETRRLRGQEVFKGPLSLFGPKILMRVYPMAVGGAYLLASRIREKDCKKPELVLASQNLLGGGIEQTSAHKYLSQAIAYRLTKQKHGLAKDEILTNLQAKEVKITPLSDVAVAARTQHFAPYDLIVKRFNVIHQDHGYRHSILESYPIAVGEVVLVANAVGIIESDLIESNGEWFVDLNSWPGAENHNLINDSSLLVVNLEKQVGIQGKPSGKVVTYESAAWLGSPMLSSWGHFVYEGLARLELLCRDDSLKDTPFLVSSKIPASFLALAEIIFPSVSFEKIPPGTVCRVKRLAVAPLRTFTPHNLHFTLEGELQRLNGEPQLFKALRERVSRIASTAETSRRSRVFVDRQFANYRQTRNTERLRSIAKKWKFEIVDPGTLDAMEQLNLFLGAQTMWGQTGSGFFLAPLLGHGARVMMVGSDFSHDWEGLAHCISDSTGRPVDLITGKRDFIRRGFSEGLYHQDFKLSERAWEKIEAWCSSN
jgi:hypothetical protein